MRLMNFNNMNGVIFSDRFEYHLVEGLTIENTRFEYLSPTNTRYIKMLMVFTLWIGE